MKILTWTRSRGTSWWLLFIPLLASLGMLLPHVIQPVTNSSKYVPLIIFLAVVNTITLLLSQRFPCIATQGYWYSVLCVVVVMTLVNRGIPSIATIPALAAVLISRLVTLKASLVYGAGVSFFLIPSGIVYNDLGKAVAYLGMMGLLVAISSVSPRLDKKTEAAFIEFRNDLQRINDAYPKE